MKDFIKMELEVLSISGKKTSKKVNLDVNIFGIEPNNHAIYLDVKHYLANQRQGTSKSKERSEISGSTKKLKRQKGTGGARIGDINSPLLRGGGRVFGPKPRDYDFKLNKKVKQLARISALTHKAKESRIMIVEDFNFEEVKTKKMLEVLNNLKISDRKMLFVFSESNKNVYLSSRNLENVSVSTASDLNTYTILRTNRLILTESSLKEIENTFNRE